jgi:biopolymer transport protein ExbD
VAFRNKRKSGDEEVELNLVPIMNLVTILIPVLLLSVQFMNLALIDSTLPAIGPPDQTPPEEDEDPPLVLSVLITAKGFTIAGADAVLKPEGEAAASAPAEGEEAEPTVPCIDDGQCGTPEDYDYAELTRLLALIKTEYPDDENVILVPESEVVYEVIVRTMDASRDDLENPNPDGTRRSLFPYVVIAGGATS